MGIWFATDIISFGGWLSIHMKISMTFHGTHGIKHLNGLF